MSISGKISVGVVTTASPPSSRMTSPMTTKVYGRLSARRTIHMVLGSAPCSSVDAASASGDSADGALPASLLSTQARLERSEEHTSELQSPCNLVCRLLLEKKIKICSNSFHILYSIQKFPELYFSYF